MKKSLFTLFVLGLMMTSGFLGYQNTNTEESTSNQNSSQQKVIDPNTISVSASWGDEPENITQLAKKSDVVVFGKVQNKLGYITPYDKDKTAVFTNVSFKPMVFLKGDGGQKNLEVDFYGGKTATGKKVVWGGIEELQTGKFYLLFLKRVDDKGSVMDGKYIPIEGPDGAYQVHPSLNKDFRNIDNISELKNVRLTVNHIVDHIQQKVMEVGMNGVVNALN